MRLLLVIVCTKVLNKLSIKLILQLNIYLITLVVVFELPAMAKFNRITLFIHQEYTKQVVL